MTPTEILHKYKCMIFVHTYPNQDLLAQRILLNIIYPIENEYNLVWLITLHLFESKFSILVLFFAEN